MYECVSALCIEKSSIKNHKKKNIVFRIEMKYEENIQQTATTTYRKIKGGEKK